VKSSGWNCQPVKAGVMSARKQTTVHRIYRLGPDHCAQALELLLKTSVRKEGRSTTNGPDSAKGGSSDSSAKTSIPFIGPSISSGPRPCGSFCTRNPESSAKTRVCGLWSWLPR
jgi:hypothetical protein